MSTHPTPRVPDIEDPQSNTPLTEDFRTGTANDPNLDYGEGMAHLTVDGQSVAVQEGATLLDAVEAVDTDGTVPAVCYYDRGDEGDAGDHGRFEVGPRSECRTCVVETDEEGLVPACSHPVEDGMTVDTDTGDASEARDVNLDLLLSNHNLRCTTCSQNGRCELQDASIENGVEHPRYGVFDDRDAYEPIDDTSSFIQIDRNKCILCNRCVEACNDVQVEGVLRVEGSGPDTRIGFQSGAETMDDSTCVSCGHCATVCPTGSLTEKGLVDATTLPFPGFDQKNSIGTVIERTPADTIETAESPNRDLRGRDLNDDLAGKSGVARFMAHAKHEATAAREAAGKRARTVVDEAMADAEHAAEFTAANSMPEGALFDIGKAVGDARLSQMDKAETTCGYCAVGCRFDLYGKDDEVLAARPADPEATPANDFSTCVKGKFGYDYVNSDERLDQPLVKENGEFREATWGEALDRVAEGLSEIQDEHGPDTVSVLSSSKTTNEENFAVQKFARQVLGTKNIDNCTRLCHSSTVAALKQTVGYGAMTNRIEDIGNTDCYLITGANTTESHPVLATRIKQNVRDGADLFVFDPRKIDLAEHADQYTRTEGGHDIAWINGMIRHIVENDLQDDEFIEERTRNFEEVKEKVGEFTPEKVEELTNVSPEELKNAAETIAEADTCVFGWAMGISQHTYGTQTVLALADLALVTGHLGKENAGLSPFRGQNNVQGGGGDMGPIPDTLPGYQELSDEDVLEKFEDAWDVRPPDEPGLRITEMFDEVDEGNLRGMYVVGENPAISEPDLTNAHESLEKLDFLAVQDIFMTETAEYADVVLPAAAITEKYGTVTNTERRVQMVRPVADPPGKAHADWEIVQKLAERLGFEWGYENPTQIMDEINELVPIYGGITHERLEERGEGLQWPCPDEDHPGTANLYTEEFNFEDGKARFVPADLGDPTEMPGEEFPIALTSGRVLYHWHTGQLTRRDEGLMGHVGESFAEIHPETAGQIGVADGEYVEVESERGSIVVKATVTDRTAPGKVFIPMHFATGAVNNLTQEELDSVSRIPDYKMASVRVRSMGSDPDREPLGTPDSTGEPVGK
ncbi:formate dehydrogenase subunit alpha [Halalkalicoccus jeotgali]|uniref:Formate dehydrogenase subunit alpha n=1 Tax=Halalkalicoccus jeotgali (strain DSM 18796 / CECT 7217 / JCM 14584 / KCTC 4019 / B3) TaxID=795797 RepID=D8J4C1_HALJB|nr:formate dehydrogenase subunit alpha [Halalkalicoccus jeotgali]ADJ13483.1 formate dehydrogenase, alpha subunit [Halalkalicoccus jeotgali B3]ELY33042.1 formate dehydrogenase subunit alpha [Halalkalicoccus jeotgali B3]